MPKRSNEFQRLVRAIETALAGTGNSVEESAMVPSRSGSHTEVDILVTLRAGQRVLRVAVECRSHKRAQHVHWIHHLHSILEEHPSIDRVVAVSNRPFSKQARKLATEIGIELRTLEDAVSEDWGNLMRWAKATVGVVGRVSGANVVYEGSPEEVPRDLTTAVVCGKDRAAQRFPVFFDEIEREVRERTLAMLDAEGRHPTGDEAVTADVAIKNIDLVFADGERRALKQIRMMIRAKTDVHTLPIRLMDYGPTKLAVASFHEDGIEAHVVAYMDADNRRQVNYTINGESASSMNVSSDNRKKRPR